MMDAEIFLILYICYAMDLKFEFKNSVEFNLFIFF